MSQILPKKGSQEIEVSDPKVIDLGSDEAEIVLDSLSSKTTRDVFMTVYEEPSAKSEIADKIDNSIQNTKYHIDKLEEASLIESKRTDYSEKGNEMDVYGPTNEAVILLASDEETKSRIRKNMKPLAATVAVGAGISAGLSRFVGMSDVRNDSKTSEPSIQTEQESSNLGVESASGDVATSDTVEPVGQIAIAFFDTSPSLAVGVSMILGVIVGLCLYMVFKRLIS